jgi:hypothetical protein
MYKEESKVQQKLEDFYLPFGGHLNPKNRWVVLSKRIPWDKLEADYADQFSSSGMGAPAKSFRMALGSLIIKEKLQISDAETVEQIQETPYLQYFIGMERYIDDEPPFDPSMMVHFRKRCNGELIGKANEILFKEYHDRIVKKNRKIRKKLQKRKG